MKILLLIILFGTRVSFAQEPVNNSEVSEFPRKEYYIGSLGPTIQSANGTYVGARISLGVAIKFSQAFPLITEFSVMHPLLTEKINGKYSGNIYRWFGFIGGKYLINDDKDFFVSARVGLGTIHNSNPSQPFFIKPVYGASVGKMIYELSTDKKIWLDLSYDYMPVVRFNSVLSSWFCATGNPIGGDDKDCENQLIPNAHIFSVNAAMTFDVK